MNKSILIGRLTKKPELKSTVSGVSVAAFTVAVNRRFKNAEGNYDADFINCVAWRQQAEFVCKYFEKGSQIGVVGSIQTRNYDSKDGQKVYVTEVAVDEVHFVGERRNPTTADAVPLPLGKGGNDGPSIPADNAGFVPMPGDDDLPF